MRRLKGGSQEKEKRPERKNERKKERKKERKAKWRRMTRNAELNQSIRHRMRRQSPIESPNRPHSVPLANTRTGSSPAMINGPNIVFLQRRVKRGRRAG